MMTISNNRSVLEVLEPRMVFADDAVLLLGSKGLRTANRFFGIQPASKLDMMVNPCAQESSFNRSENLTWRTVCRFLEGAIAQATIPQELLNEP
jgi:hypothetical protein